ncbi:YceD family protein [Roseovarius nitratireducens]|uniref:YceD family protein n=1 Tax=Roseovarius nitratireducens TaxID=2044597 RepID=UPI000CE18E13|nr:YceD family protein [Roseovarius nitratireducens]
MSADTGSTHRIPVPRLARHGGHRFEIVPDAAARATLAARLDLLDLRKLSLRGEITPDGPRDWLLSATLGATVVQPCGVTLAPVTTRIDETVTRRYTPDATPPEAAPVDEIEMPEDDTIEPLGAVIDLDAVLAEALALALPPWPRSDAAELGTLSAAPDGAENDDDDAPRRPFAGLAGLRDRLAGNDDDEGNDSGPSG